jgi:hypothetical protein
MTPEWSGARLYLECGRAATKITGDKIAGATD